VYIYILSISIIDTAINAIEPCKWPLIDMSPNFIKLGIYTPDKNILTIILVILDG
jgi:hypothetical protein